MNPAHIPYRAWQFWQALFPRPDTNTLQAARAILSPSLWEIFTAMQPGEQAHSLNVFRQLQFMGETNQDLLIAALLHDTGKSLHPLRLWERVWIVIHTHLFPGAISRWAQRKPGELAGLAFWQRALAVAASHPAWGAQMAAERGAPETVIALIAAHQDNTAYPVSEYAQTLLAVLQSVDDSN